MGTRTKRGLAVVNIDPIWAGWIATPFVILSLWQLSSLVLGSDLLPGVFETGRVMLEANWIVPGLAETMEATVLAFGIAVVVGVVFGTLLGLHDTAFRFFEPFVYNTYAIPKIVLYPIFLLVFQLGLDQKVAFGAFHGIFPMLIITMRAARDVPEIFINLGRTLRLGPVKQFRYIMLPPLLIRLVVGFRLTFSLSFLGVILSELFAAKSGLGLQIQHFMSRFIMDDLMAAVTALIIVAFVINITLYALQQWLQNRWNYTVDSTDV